MRRHRVIRTHERPQQRHHHQTLPASSSATPQRAPRCAPPTVRALTATALGALVMGAALAPAPAALARDSGDIAVVAALDGAAVPRPARKPTAITQADAIPVPPPVPPQWRADLEAETAAEPDDQADGLTAFVTEAGHPQATTETPRATDLTLASLPGGSADPTATPTGPATLPPAPVQVAARVDRGDTLIGLLIDAGVARLEAHKAVTAMEELFDPRRMRPGYVVNIRFSEPEGDQLGFLGFDFEPATGTRILVLADPDSDAGYGVQEIKEALTTETVRFGGPITLSLYQAAVEAGVSEAALADMIRVLSYDIDFQRDIQKDDTFEIMYEQYLTADGRHVRDGDILFVALTNNGERIAAYAFETEDGFIDHFDEDGHGIRKPLMRTPIDGARLSSSFGMRHHPILGYSRMHTGVDFAAPTGTPIYAAGDGVVHYAGRKGGYGKYVQLRHNAEFATAYAHMSRILVENGQRVEQGDVIGRVGSTGRSTGPHLHYEIIRNGRKVNPLDVRFPPAVRLAGAELERFQAHRVEVDRLYASLRDQTEIASTRGDDSPQR
ncbi:peptidoglycan DD-metalloendopeptidase family protein [Roseospira navarrensis]|uniref:Peptidoglycan DD-metalloendopeptidase family protein n=1 Tax=Roseospira navarrensis TaxID=140058 RepID=A0A7X1ZHE4_9PROT|nr:peptidoglycan DD-metalloendopeptidase family protein [Roseospira navarrensis]MQX38555.1 peptidoglycan DD-metalloendopeptidase family protein [Roseospira navarrensis]